MLELILATVSNCAWAVVFAYGIAYCRSCYPYFKVFDGSVIYSDPEHCYYEKWAEFRQENEKFSELRDKITSLLDVPRFRGDGMAKFGLGVLIFSKFATTTIFFYRDTNISWGYWLILILPTVILLALMFIHHDKHFKYIQWKFGKIKDFKYNRVFCPFIQHETYNRSYFEEQWYADKAMTDIKTALCLMNDRIEWLNKYQHRLHEYVTNWFTFTTIVTVINLITSFLWVETINF